jgi:hypothetical protein
MQETTIVVQMSLVRDCKNLTISLVRIDPSKYFWKSLLLARCVEQQRFWCPFPARRNMKIFTSVARVAAVAALVTTGFVAVAASPAMAAGCSNGYVSVTTYEAGHCTGYASYFKVRAQAKCNGTWTYGVWTPITGYSYAICQSGQVQSSGTYTVSP